MLELLRVFVEERLVSFWDVFLQYAPRVFWAIIVLVIFYYLARFGKMLVHRAMEKSPFDNTLNTLTSATTAVVIFIIGLVAVLSILNLEKAAVSLLAGAGIVGIALAFAFQDSAANLLAGVILAFRRPFKIRHLIKFGDFEGRVRSIGLRTTTIDIPSGETVEIPNRMIIENPLTNYTNMGKRRVDFVVGVSYDENLDFVKKITKHALKEVKDVQEIELFFSEFGDSSINLLIRIWIPFKNSNKDFHAARDEAIRRIKRAYDKEDILIPWPITTLDFGIKGGVNLKDQLRKR